MEERRFGTFDKSGGVASLARQSEEQCYTNELILTSHFSLKTTTIYVCIIFAIVNSTVKQVIPVDKLKGLA